MNVDNKSKLKQITNKNFIVLEIVIYILILFFQIKDQRWQGHSLPRADTLLGDFLFEEQGGVQGHYAAGDCQEVPSV